MKPSGAAVGTICAISAFTIWGLAPLYYKVVAEVGRGELLAHRILWSLVILMVWAFFQRKSLSKTRIGPALKYLPLSAVLLAANWLLIILAVQIDRVTEISLGFFLNPLLNVLLGALILREKMSRPQVLAVVMAALGVGALVLDQGRMPWVALGVGGSFALYGLVRKVLSTDAMPGMLVETAVMSPLALVWMVWVGMAGEMHFANVSVSLDLMLAFGGIMSVAPLAFFLAGVRRLPLSTVGLIQYIAPTLNLLLAVKLYGEPFTRAHAIAFFMIWAGLAVFSTAVLLDKRKHHSRSTPAS